jgi:hypothetical protein
MNNSSTTKNSSRTKQPTTALNTGFVSSALSDDTTTTTTTVATTKSIAGRSDSSSPIGIDAKIGSSNINSLRSSCPYIDSICFFKDNDDDDTTSIGTIEDDFVPPSKLLYTAVNIITNNVMHMNNRGIFNTMVPPHHLFPIKKAIGICANSNYSSIDSLGSRPYIDSFPLFKDDDDTTSIGTIEDVSSFEEPFLLLPSSRISPKIIFG